MEKTYLFCCYIFCSTSRFHDIRIRNEKQFPKRAKKISETIHKEYLQVVVVWPIMKQNRDGQEKSEELVENISYIENVRYFSH